MRSLLRAFSSPGQEKMLRNWLIFNTNYSIICMMTGVNQATITANMNLLELMFGGQMKAIPVDQNPTQYEAIRKYILEEYNSNIAEYSAFITHSGAFRGRKK